jgi:hypothetical protein
MEKLKKQRHTNTFTSFVIRLNTFRWVRWLQNPNKKILILIIVIALAFNAYTFVTAFQITTTDYSSQYARDFSAYYMGEWRLFHNPNQVYAPGIYQPGDYVIHPEAQIFKYAPSFLIFMAPILTLSYQDALRAFDVVQFLSVFALAFFVYKIANEKSIFLGALSAVVVLLAFAPLVPSYYWGYAQGNAHVLQNTLIVGALYFAFTKKPFASAFLLAVGAFDPRAMLFALPLLLWYNRGSLVKFAVGTVAFISVLNVPFFFYHNIAWTFMQTEGGADIVSQVYVYDLIAFFSIATLSIVEIINYFEPKFRLRLLANSSKAAA